MKKQDLLQSITFLLLFLSMPGIPNNNSQDISTQSKPNSRQAGKDVIWVPTSQVLVEKMLDIAKVNSQDFVIDLGSGDGRTVISAAKRGARARGVEFDPSMIALSRKIAREQGVSEKTEFIQGDLFKADLSKATVITLFLLPSINLRLRPALLDLKPGTRIVSNTFRMGEWDPDETIKAEAGCDTWCEALLWIVPAKVEGKWNIPQGEIKFDQEFQKISGFLKSGKKAIRISEGKLNGNQIRFVVNKDRYIGFVDNDKIEGVIISGHNNTKWIARREVKNKI
jgi:SAM-dependent methyltransferase